MSHLVLAGRQLRKSPGFTLLAVLTLTVGLGLSATIFSLIDDLFLKGLPFPDAGRIVRIYGEAKERNLNQLPCSVPRFWHFRDGQTVFSSIGADLSGVSTTLTGLGEPVQINVASVTANYLDLLGVRPILGRGFLSQEESSADVAIINARFWRNRLKNDPAVLGRSITLDGVPHTIVGVISDTPVAWYGLDLEVLTTKPFEGKNLGLSRDRLMRGAGFLRVIGRLKPGVTVDQANAAISTLQYSYHEKNPEKHDSLWTNTLVTAPEDVTGNLRPAFATLVTAVSFVLLIACTNVANLLLVRFTSRRREIALRIVLGGSRFNIIGLFIAESMLVSLLGGVSGVTVAWQLIQLVAKLTGANVPIDPEIGLRASVFAFVIVLSLAVGLGTGLYPAWQSSRVDLAGALKEEGRSTTGSLGQQRMRKLLIGAQVALSITLLAAALLMIASFIRLRNQDLGFQPDHVWVGSVNLPVESYPDMEDRARFAQRFLEEMRSFPNIESVSVSEAVPLTPYGRSYYATTDHGSVPIGQRPVAPLHYVTPGFFRTLGIPLLGGRDFEGRDAADGRLVTVISRSMAKKLFGDKNAVGQQLLVGSNKPLGEPAEIVGVVGDVRSAQVGVANDAEFYRPWAQINIPTVRIAVRSYNNENEIMQIVRRTLSKIDPGLAVLQPGPISSIIDASLGQARLMTTLIGGFATIALLLATVGIYGAVAYTVEQRTGEIGVRMALGAQTMDVLRLIIRQGMTPVVVGLLAGLVAAIALGRLLAAQLYQISPYNPFLLASGAVLFTIAALFACVIPARRAALLNPVLALRAN